MSTQTSKADYYIQKFAREIGCERPAFIDNDFSSIDHSINLDGCVATAHVSCNLQKQHASIIIRFPFGYEKERAKDLVNACNYINRWGGLWHVCVQQRKDQNGCY